MSKKFLNLFFVIISVSLLFVACGEENNSSQGSSNTSSFQGIALPDNTRQLPVAESDLSGSVEYGHVIGFFINTGDYSTIKTFLTSKMVEKGYKLVQTENSQSSVSGINWTYEKGTDAYGSGTSAYEEVVISLAGPLREDDIIAIEKSADVFKDKLAVGEKFIVVNYFSVALETITANARNSMPPNTTSAPNK